MPIRFRCSMCSGMLSIARRKAGTQVECPKCGYEVTVPEVDTEPETKAVAVIPKSAASEKPETAPARPVPDRPLFEQSDFDELLDAKIKKTTESTAPLPPAAQPRAVTMTEDEGIKISRAVLVGVVVGAMVLVVLAFAIGFLVGS